jgi:hypothetical protein
MNYKVVIDSGADEDFAEACLWYEGRQPGLNQYFADSFRALALQLSHSPQRYPIVYRQYRKAPMDNFPFVVHFQLIGDTVVVFAMTHSSRHERVWKKRLRERSKRR